MTVAIEYDMEAIARIVAGRLKPSDKATQPKYLSVDSRKIVAPESTLFWAISTEQRDGSIFIPELYSRGVRNFITEDEKISRRLKGVNVILVKNSLLALQKLAAYHRNRFKKLRVIGVTGSNGKTIVKDWLYALLSPYYDVVRSPRSFNSQIGVPLSILQIRSHHAIGIFEAGISKPGEMKALERMIQPQVGIFTNIGTAHDEGFSDRDEKTREKLLLFSRSETLVYPEEEKEITENIL
ncbi:MAG TPA: Mur ligase family protein, partial [Ginsengibacter sp.]|nr:Mur ligase family protein [Ginsengibacter sp.]